MAVRGLHRGTGLLHTDIWNYVVVLGLALVIYRYRNWLRMYWLALRLRGPPAVPVLGNVLLLADSDRLVAEGKKYYVSYGPVSRCWLSLIPMFFVASPHAIQRILSSQKHIDKIYAYKLLRNFLGNGLVTSSGETWKSHRKLMQPMFHLTALEQFSEAFVEAAEKLVAQLKTVTKDQSAVNVTSHINGCILNILKDVLLGEKQVPIDYEASQFRGATYFAVYRLTRPWLFINSIYRLTSASKSESGFSETICGFISKAVKKRKQQRTEEMGKSKPATCERDEMPVAPRTERTPLIDRMLDVADNNPNFNDEDIVHELSTLILGGQDSVSAAIPLCLFMLATHPDAQRRVVDEIDDVLQGSDRPLRFTDLRQLRYLDQCIKETLRLFPVVPFVARRLAGDVDLGKHTLPAGSQVLISPFVTHRIPEIYPDPERFDPDRFLPEQVKERHPYAYIPFSAGPRNCIGYKFAETEMKLIISTLLRSYQLSAVPGRDNLNITYRITIRIRGGVWINCTPRS